MNNILSTSCALATKTISWFLLLSLSFLLFSCSKSKEVTAVTPKGNRQVAVHITTAESNSYDTDFQRVKALGVDVIPLTVAWNSIDTTGGFDFSTLDIINAYYPANHKKVSINVTPLYAVSRAFPNDLQSKSFNDPLVISRFKILLDSIHARLPDAQINNFIIGLEVDIYLNNNPGEYAAYQAFYDSAIVHVKKLWGSSMPVGVETTWSSAAFDTNNNIATLNKNSDMMVLSYYPLNDDFTVEPPTIVHSDVETIIALYPKIPIFIVECGYQTSASCNSSPQLQQQFVTEMFKLWDDHADKINFIGFLWLTDLSDADVDQYVIDYGQSNSPNLNSFKGYLQTTGLRTYPGEGSDKLGFTQLKTELASRGW
jgi:hypothetical protein